MGDVKLTDMIIVVPGILGSVLRQGDDDVWNPSSPGFLGGRLIGLPLDGLALANRLEAVDLIRIPFGLRKLLSSKGYDLLMDRVADHFAVESTGRTCSNLHPFPYDWRQDNRESARLLKEFVDERLDEWRRETGRPDAKAIFLAHSMGGLVCRYYLECLGGAADCRLLVTFGTPHRGSVCAVDSLLSGHTVGRTDVSDLMETLPSMYQLLPTYKSCYDGSAWLYPWQLPQLQGINKALLDDAKAFHEELNAAVSANIAQATTTRHALCAIVGTEQPTIQRAQPEGANFVYTDAMPDELNELPRFGDGTVPHIGAIPQELSNSPSCVFVPEHHGFLHANDAAVDNAFQLIETLQSGQLAKARGIMSATPSAGQAALSLHAASLGGQHIDVSVALHNSGVQFGKAVVKLRDALSGDLVSQATSVETLGPVACRVTIEVPAAGMYEVRVESEFQPQGAPSPVHELVETE